MILVYQGETLGSCDQRDFSSQSSKSGEGARGGVHKGGQEGEAQGCMTGTGQEAVRLDKQMVSGC